MSEKKNASYENVYPDTYLLLEESAIERSEYYAGRMIKMAGASLNHARISSNIIAQFDAQLRETHCEVLASDVKLAISSREKFYYPDVMVVCGDIDRHQNRNDVITNPMVVIEIISKSTEATDRGMKFHDYQSISSVQMYVIIDQYDIKIDVFIRKSEMDWHYRTYTKDDEEIVFTPIAAFLSIEKLYHRVKGLESLITV